MHRPSFDKLADKTAVKKSWEAARHQNATNLVEALKGWIPDFAREWARKLRSPLCDEDDISHQVYRKAYEKTKSTGWVSISHFLNSLFTIQRNAAIDFHRQEHGRTTQTSDDSNKHTRPVTRHLDGTYHLLQATVSEFQQVDQIALQEALVLLEQELKIAYSVIQFRYLLQPSKPSIMETAKQLHMRREHVLLHEAHGFDFLRKHL